MELAIFKNQVPIKAIPEKSLNAMIMGEFLDWISKTLSLNEDAVTKLEYALPAIKQHCWSMGFPEIKKMIEMYADGNLSVKPIPNHFDRIKLGEVANAYRQQKPKPKVLQIQNEIPEEEKEKIVKSGVLRVYSHFVEHGIVPSGSGHIYDTLFSLGVLPEHTKEFREAVESIALRQLKAEAKRNVPSVVKSKLKELENSKGALKAKCKHIILHEYFTDIVTRNLNINEVIK